MSRSRMISYAHSSIAWAGYEDFLCELIKKHNLRKVCDVGGGANPILDAEKIAELGIEYSLLDISSDELEKAPASYKKILADITADDLGVDANFDLVISKMLAEHVADGKQFHSNVKKILSDDGLAVHFFPTLYAFPFVVNFLLPESLAHKILDLVSPRDYHQHAKFPAHYQWCRGPTKRQIKRLEKLGYSIVEYRGFFGHESYYRRLGPLLYIHRLFAKLLLKNPNPHLTSFAYLVLRKTESPGLA